MYDLFCPFRNISSVNDDFKIPNGILSAFFLININTGTVVFIKLHVNALASCKHVI